MTRDEAEKWLHAKCVKRPPAPTVEIGPALPVSRVVDLLASLGVQARREALEEAARVAARVCDGMTRWLEYRRHHPGIDSYRVICERGDSVAEIGATRFKLTVVGPTRGRVLCALEPMTSSKPRFSIRNVHPHGWAVSYTASGTWLRPESWIETRSTFEPQCLFFASIGRQDHPPERQRFVMAGGSQIYRRDDSYEDSDYPEYHMWYSDEEIRKYNRDYNLSLYKLVTGHTAWVRRCLAQGATLEAAECALRLMGPAGFQ